MESYSNVVQAREAERTKQAELRRQISALTAQLRDVTPPPLDTSMKRKLEPKVIAAGTPSPKKRRVEPGFPPGKHSTRAHLPLQPKSTANQPNSSSLPDLPPVRPSKLLSNLASIHGQSKVIAEPIERSTSFSQAPITESRSRPPCQERDDRLALIETLTPGPRDYDPPVDDPHFSLLEPNSGIYLSERKLPHAELQQHLRGRYYLSPSLMYSVIRPLPSNQGYDISVPGDWLTIAVIAERGPIKLTTTSSTAHNDDDHISTRGTKDWKGKKKDDDEDKKTGAKKYMSLKLVDFGTRGRSSAGAPKAQGRGDTLLTLLLFEADSWSYIVDETQPKPSKSERAKVYKGGSGGAFEACMKLHEGAVIAILNPKILKPYQRNTTTPHPTNNILAITPTSAQSIAIIGHARDLGMCGAMKRDGKVCGSWCDKRVSDCCEYHVEHAVQRKRAGRAEFSMGTSGMTTTPHGRKPGFDPERKWGLLPSADTGLKSTPDAVGGSTYVIPGHVISASGPEYVGEKLGRGRQEKNKRQREEKETEEMLSRLLGREGGGEGGRNAAAGAVRKAREVMQMLKGSKPAVKQRSHKDRKSAYSAEAIKSLGFDPISKRSRECSEGDVQRKLDILTSLQKERGDIILRPRPGKRLGSSVTVPEREGATLQNINGRARCEDSDDELEVDPPV